MLSEQDRSFVTRRRRGQRALLWLAALCTLGWIALWGYLARAYPLAVNPLELLGRVGATGLDEATLVGLAGLAPILAALLFIGVLGFLLMVLGFALERGRLLRIIETLHTGRDP